MFGIAVVGFFWRIAFRTRVEGVDRIPPSGPAIVAGNHVSALDGVVLTLMTGTRGRRTTRFLVAAEFFHKLWCGWALRLYRQIPLRRGERDQGALDIAIETIRGGALAGIFPEGGVGPGPLQRGRRGAARIALAAGVPLIPAAIWGTHHRWPRSGFTLNPPWRPKVAAVFGPPITPVGAPRNPQDVRELTDRLMQEIAQALDRARRIAGP